VKGKKILLISISVIIIMIIAVVVFYSQASIEEKEIETMIYSPGSKFQTNLKDSRSLISISIQIEVVDEKKFLVSIEERNPELRSKILDILRDKTVEDVNGRTGKKMLESEILACLRKMFDKDMVVNLYIDDIVVQ